MKHASTLPLHPLPEAVVMLLQSFAVHPHLLAHLVLVHDVAFRLLQGIEITWPELAVDRDAVLFGAATHDIGKILHPDEMVGPGQEHHASGVKLLTSHGVSQAQARFARTHATWNNESDMNVEDLLVALADTIWAGGRDRALEDALTEHLLKPGTMAPWEIYMHLDDLITEITADSELRLIWQTQFAPSSDSPGSSEN